MTQLTTSTRPTRAQARGHESREKLLAAARQSFVERGYHATRPQDIARAAGVGHGTFYLHFADKRACFLAFVDQARQELEAELEQRLPQEAGLEQRIRTLLLGLHDYEERHPGVLRTALTDLSVIGPGEAGNVSLLDRWAGDWAQALSRGMAAGAIRADYDPWLLGHAIVGLIQGASRSGHARRIGRERVVDNLVRFLMRALTPTGTASRGV